MSGRGFLCVIASVTALVACGGSGDDAAVDALKDYLAAVESGDDAKACELLSKDYVEWHAVAHAEPCAEGLDATANPAVVKEIEAGEYKLTRDRGRVAVRPDSGLGGYELMREDGEWRLVSPG